MEKKESLLQKSNPLRPDLRWEFVLVQGAAAVAIGLYALLAEESARRNIVFLIGVFLLVNGLGIAIGGIRRAASDDPMSQFRLVRAGIGIATGVLVVINRFSSFMEVNSARVVAGIGLAGIGLVSLIGIITLIDRSEARLVSAGASLLLILWGAASIYQAIQDTNSSRLIGWAALIIGAALIALGLMRRQRAMEPAPVA